MNKNILKILAVGITSFFLSSQAFVLGSSSNKRPGSANLGSPSCCLAQSYDQETTNDIGKTRKEKSYVDHGTPPGESKNGPDVGKSESGSSSGFADRGSPDSNRRADHVEVPEI